MFLNLITFHPFHSYHLGPSSHWFLPGFLQELPFYLFVSSSGCPLLSYFKSVFLEEDQQVSCNNDLNKSQWVWRRDDVERQYSKPRFYHDIVFCWYLSVGEEKYNKCEIGKFTFFLSLNDTERDWRIPAFFFWFFEAVLWKQGAGIYDFCSDK